MISQVCFISKKWELIKIESRWIFNRLAWWSDGQFCCYRHAFELEINESSPIVVLLRDDWAKTNLFCCVFRRMMGWMRLCGMIHWFIKSKLISFNTNLYQSRLPATRKETTSKWNRFRKPKKNKRHDQPDHQIRTGLQRSLRTQQSPVLLTQSERLPRAYDA